MKPLNNIDREYQTPCLFIVVLGNVLNLNKVVNVIKMENTGNKTSSTEIKRLVLIL